jgi:hypothetical protein
MRQYGAMRSSVGRLRQATFAELVKIVVGAFNDAPPKRQASYNLLRGILKRHVTSEV